MVSSHNIPLVRASVLEPFVEVASQIGAPVEKLLRSVRLTDNSVADAELLLPELPCWQFVQSLAMLEGIPDLGLIAGNTITHGDLGTLVSLTSGCNNLFDVLKRFCLLAPRFSNNNLYVLETEGHLVRFIQKGRRLVAGDIQVELFEVLGMIQLVQLAAGPNWRPDEIHFSFHRQTVVEHAGELNPSRILYSRRYPSIAVPRHLLPLPLRVSHARTTPDACNPTTFASIPASISERLRDAIIPYLGTGELSKNFIADALGMSPRTLHRRLTEESASYSWALDQARLLKAATLLQETDMKLLDITLMLGYENASSFSRAFRRWAGVSPREYRLFRIAS